MKNLSQSEPRWSALDWREHSLVGGVSIDGFTPELTSPVPSSPNMVRPGVVRRSPTAIAFAKDERRLSGVSPAPVAQPDVDGKISRPTTPVGCRRGTGLAPKSARKIRGFVVAQGGGDLGDRHVGIRKPGLRHAKSGV